jgi:RNA polymerase sigma-70 factor (ECF subfamily)
MSTATPTQSAILSDPETWVDRHGSYLFGFAMKRLRDPVLAEELVQEALLAALQSRDRFQGRSSERSWLVGILKHKIIDHFRRVSRERPAEDVAAWPDEFKEPFDEDGHWRVEEGEGPIDWGAQPLAALQQKEFQEVLSRCLTKLPPRMAEAFTLREMEELETDEICKILNVSSTNLWVILHRARLQLRRCLEVNWFGPARGGAGAP